jgi:FlaA1/EpsC-like NDP-sugar epimerase
MTAANSVRRGDKRIFAVARCGNILGSLGSIIPVFERQIAEGDQSLWLTSA